MPHLAKIGGIFNFCVIFCKVESDQKEKKLNVRCQLTKRTEGVQVSVKVRRILPKNEHYTDREIIEIHSSSQYRY